ncbi:MAG TPA: hypothetical protein VGI85_10535 [Chthoniobacterales bacterium]
MEEPIFTYYDIIWFPDTFTAEELGSRNGQGGMANATASPTATPGVGSNYGSEPGPTPSATPTSASYNYNAAPTATASPYPNISPH